MKVEQDALDTSEDAVLGGRLRLRQPLRGHRFGHDAILLAAATEAHAGERAIELGAGVGAAGLALASRIAGLKVTLAEIDPSLCALAKDNAARNALAGRVDAVALDVTDTRALAAAGLSPACADRVLMNPPFNDPARQNVSPDAARRLAHAAPRDALPLWTASAACLLKDGGMLTMIWRADGLHDVTDALGGHFGALAVLPIYPRPGAPAIRVLVRAIKGAQAGITTGRGLALNGEDGRPSAAAEAVLRGGETLSFANH